MELVVCTMADQKSMMKGARVAVCHSPVMDFSLRCLEVFGSPSRATRALEVFNESGIIDAFGSGRLVVIFRDGNNGFGVMVS